MVPPLCRGNIEFLDLETFALLFVKNTVQDAIDVIVNRNQPKDIPNKKSSDLLDKGLFQDVTSTDTFDQSIDESVSAFSTPYLVNIHNKKFNEWPNIGLFRKADMIEYIKRFVNKWELKCNWMYCIDFLCEERNKSSDTYFYDVSYMFEGSGLVHKPYKIQFNEEWLLSILQNKIRFISTLQF